MVLRSDCTGTVDRRQQTWKRNPTMKTRIVATCLCSSIPNLPSSLSLLRVQLSAPQSPIPSLLRSSRRHFELSTNSRRVRGITFGFCDLTVVMVSVLPNFIADATTTQISSTISLLWRWHWWIVRNYSLPLTVVWSGSLRCSQSANSNILTSSKSVTEEIGSQFSLEFVTILDDFDWISWEWGWKSVCLLGVCLSLCLRMKSWYKYGRPACKSVNIMITSERPIKDDAFG
jgi:hypothetical protein